MTNAAVVPQPVRTAQRSLFVMAAAHVGLAGYLAMHAEVIRSAVAAQHLPVSADGLLAQLILPQLIIAVVLPLRGRKLAGGRRKTQVIMTVLLGVQMVSLLNLGTTLKVLPGSGLGVLVLNGIAAAFALVALWSLWGTAPARAFFTRRPGAAAAPAQAAAPVPVG